MAGPIVLGSLSWTLMQFVDQVMVAKLGAEALAAVGSAGLWSFTLTTFFLGIVSCVTTFAAQSLGRGEKQDCARYAWQGVHIALLTGVFAILLWPFTDTIFATMGHSPETTRLEVVYFRIRLLGFAFIAWQSVLATFFQAVNRPLIPMFVALAANVFNAAAAYVLIFGKFGFPRWGVAGAAVATVLSLALQAGLLQWAFLSPSIHAEYGTRNTYRIDVVRVRELFRIGWPAGVQFFLDVANWAVFTSYLVGGFGTAALAANTAAVSLMHMSFMPAVGLHHAIAPIVGQWIGRGDIATAKARTYTAMRLAMVYMALMGLVFATLGKPMLRAFFSSDPEVIRTGHLLLILAAIFQAFDAVNIVISGALRGAGDTRFMAVVTFIGGYCVFLPAAFVLGRIMGWGAVGAWVGLTIYIMPLAATLFWRFDREQWRRTRIFERDRVADAGG